MNIITRYKKTVLSAVVLVAMNMGAADAPKCSPCQAAAAARQSARDAAAAALLLTGKTIAREMELDTNLVSHNAPRAPREELVNLCNTCGICEEEVTCPVETTNCCDVVNFIACQVLRQGRDARKCCKKIKHELKDIEELTELQISQSAACCSSIDSQLSVLDVLAVSQIDQSAACCSALATQITNLNISVADAISLLTVNLNASIADVLALLTLVFDCTCT